MIGGINREKLLENLNLVVVVTQKEEGLLKIKATTKNIDLLARFEIKEEDLPNLVESLVKGYREHNSTKDGYILLAQDKDYGLDNVEKNKVQLVHINNIGLYLQNYKVLLKEDTNTSLNQLILSQPNTENAVLLKYDDKTNTVMTLKTATKTKTIYTEEDIKELSELANKKLGFLDAIKYFGKYEGALLTKNPVHYVSNKAFYIGFVESFKNLYS